MWRSQVGNSVAADDVEDDDWETDPDFVNDISEKESRWGSKSIEGSGHSESLDLKKLRGEVHADDTKSKQKDLESGPKASYGYGGKFGVEKDRMDKSAVSMDHVEQLSKHTSQKDYAKGFGGKYGVQKDRQDKSSLGFDYQAKLEQHSSQKDYSTGFGGKYGVQKDNVDKSAVGWEYQSELSKHDSQKDYSQGFGGKYGVQKDRVDKSALSYEDQTKVALHPSQTDMTKGFGGKFGVDDRQDSSAKSYDDIEPASSSYKPVRSDPSRSGGAGNLKAKFESMANAGEEESRKRQEEERQRRMTREKKEREEQKRIEEERQRQLAEEQASQEPEPEPQREPTPEPVREPSPEPEPQREPTPEPEPEPEPPARRLPSPNQGRELPSIPPSEPEVARQDSPPPLPPPNQPKQDDVDLYDDTGFAANPTKASPIEEPPEAMYSEPAVDIHNSRTHHHEETSSHEQPMYDEVPREQEPEPEPEQEYGNVTPGEQDSGLTAIAIYDYQATDEDELTFDPDELVTNIKQVDEGWWQGECRGKVGLFPANYVELTT